MSAAVPQRPAAIEDLTHDPSIAARKLYDAWQAKDRKAGAAIASGHAVAKLFTIAPAPLTYTHCQRTDVGEFQCVYHNAKTNFEVWFKVLGGASAGYHVEAVSFSTD